MTTYNPLVPPPLRNKQPAVDLAGFFDLIQEAFKLHVESEGTPKGVVPILVESFPKERLSQPDAPFNVITYRIGSSCMAASTNDGKKPRGITLRQSKQSKEKSDYLINIYGWWEQVTVIFEIWCKDNADANALAIWFHKFIFTWAFIYKFFEGRGILNFDFVERMEDSAPRVDEQEIYLRQLSYTFKLETLTAAEQRKLTSLSLIIESPSSVAPINLPETSTN